ncbi:hypothetical protein V8C44DRAFT_342798 [Trichoderma aethiopicum]
MGVRLGGGGYCIWVFGIVLLGYFAGMCVMGLVWVLEKGLHLFMDYLMFGCTLVLNTAFGYGV